MAALKGFLSTWPRRAMAAFPMCWRKGGQSWLGLLLYKRHWLPTYW